MLLGWLPEIAVGQVAQEPPPAQFPLPAGDRFVACNESNVFETDDPALCRAEWASTCPGEQAPRRAELAAVVWFSEAEVPPAVIHSDCTYVADGACGPAGRGCGGNTGLAPNQLWQCRRERPRRREALRWERRPHGCRPFWVWLRGFGTIFVGTCCASKCMGRARRRHPLPGVLARWRGGGGLVAASPGDALHGELAQAEENLPRARACPSGRRGTHGNPRWRAPCA